MVCNLITDLPNNNSGIGTQHYRTAKIRISFWHKHQTTFLCQYYEIWRPCPSAYLTFSGYFKDLCTYFWVLNTLTDSNIWLEKFSGVNQKWHRNFQFKDMKAPFFHNNINLKGVLIMYASLIPIYDREFKSARHTAGGGDQIYKWSSKIPMHQLHSNCPPRTSTMHSFVSLFDPWHLNS